MEYFEFTIFAEKENGDELVGQKNFHNNESLFYWMKEKGWDVFYTDANRIKGIKIKDGPVYAKLRKVELTFED